MWSVYASVFQPSFGIKRTPKVRKSENKLFFQLHRKILH
jgi:hypothetical protein